MANAVVEKKAGMMRDVLVEAGYEIDPITIITILTTLFQFFKDCIPTPKKAYQRLSAFGADRWYLGANVDRARVLRVIRESGCCDGGCPEDCALAAVRDVASTFTLTEVEKAYQG